MFCTVISIHPPHVGRDAGGCAPTTPPLNFNPPSPCGEGRPTVLETAAQYTFQSTLPMRGGTVSAGFHPIQRIFQSTLPMRGGTCSLACWASSCRISIHPPHAGRDLHDAGPVHVGKISIHPPHAGRDSAPRRGGRRTHISIHPPHAGRDLGPRFIADAEHLFQSTLPMRGGTFANLADAKEAVFQSTLPMRGGTKDE